MSDTFDPGPGWREVQGTEAVGKRRVFELDENGEIERVWVREVPVPPLPTEPYTVIRVTWTSGARAGVRDALWLSPSGTWVDELGTIFDPSKHIDGFVVLSEPRATTAKAIADGLDENGLDVAGAAVRRLFGVES